ncbi:hypothetical protein RIF23_16165 [Lipingzhangella sp. LS1_29]|uniref:Uncharacterized protein n=1 Tax=Lipingzhangella rawalii TaxID=2055835 RepID=A0ABU2H945_9ACTN|nr:hypothetical protein [Lipingzhangella rawalii]MDS1271829.1 hypothetical protein [Lipingzhangella rawalii]
MSEFLIGMLSSITATTVTLAVGWTVSRHMRHGLTRLLSRLTGLGVHRVYRRQRDAEWDVAADIAAATWVRVLTGRGNALTREAFAPLWLGRSERVECTRILLPDPDQNQDSWLQLREGDMCDADPGFATGLLSAQVRTNASYLAEVARDRSDIELNYYDLPNTCRIIATDQAAYITFYRGRAHGRNSPCLYARRPGLMYEIALHLFDTAWRKSRPVQREGRSS